MSYVWGLDLGGTKIEGVILPSDGSTTPICRTRIATEADRGYDHIVKRIAELIALIETESGHKRPGRIGDSPIIGAGTYANNATCAVSGTGDGEYFIRAVVGHEVSTLIQYRGMSVTDAAEQAIKKVGELGGTGGLIAIDREGHVAMPFNTSGMYRGRVDPDGKFIIEIYR